MKDFIALTSYNSDENILVRKDNIMAVYERHKSGNQTTSILSLGNGAVIEVKEDWCKIVGYLTENEMEDKERIIEECNKIGCTTFSPFALGMSDDEWHKLIAGLSD